jgi:hypothetical protein
MLYKLTIEHRASSGHWRVPCPLGSAVPAKSRPRHTAAATGFGAPVIVTVTDSDTVTEALVRKGLASRVSLGSAAGYHKTPSGAPALSMPLWALESW